MFNLQGRANLLTTVACVVLGALCAALISLAPHTAQASTMRIEVDEDYTQAYQILDLVNQQRKAAGLNSLTMDKDLMSAAMTRAAEISVLYSHTRPSGKACLTASNKMKGENIALGQANSSAVMSAWMASQGHKENILYKNYTAIGVGVVKVGNYYCWVQCFGWDKVSTCSKPGNTYNKIVSISFDASTVVASGGTFAVYPVEGDGETCTEANGSLMVGSSQRYALCALPWSESDYYRTKVQDSDVTWSVNNSGVVKLNTSNGTVTAVAPGSFTLTAKTAGGLISKSVARSCEYRTYNVVFRSQGYYYGTTQKIVQGGTVTKPKDPTKSGYTFMGWYTDAACRTPYDFSSPVSASFTLYAKFQSKSGATITGSSTLKQTKGSSITSFYDVPSGAWYYSWVTEAAQRGLMSGPTDASGNPTGYFQPENEVTRAQVATILWRIAGQPGTSTDAMWDAQGHWAEDAIAWCVSQGIITGYTSGDYQGMFRPDAAVTRQELAVMVWRFAKWAGVTTGSASTSAFNKCVDTALVANWAKDAMVWCAAAGIITGSNESDGAHLNPDSTANRAQAAKIFVQLQKLACGEIAPYTGDDGTADPGTDDVTFDEVTFDEITATTPVSGATENGLAYVIVRDTDVDGEGNAFVLDREYAELGGRYEGPGAYVLGYAGASSELALPGSIEGAQVVAANLAWGEGRTFDMAADLELAGGKAQAQSGQTGFDDAGHTRLTALTISADSDIVALDVSGNLLQGIEVAATDETSVASVLSLSALRFLDLSLNPVTAVATAQFPALEALSLAGCPLDAQSLATLAAWAGATGLTANLADAGYTAPETAEADAQVETADTAATAADTAQGTTFEAVEFEAVVTDSQDAQAGQAQIDDTAETAEVVESSDAPEAELTADQAIDAAQESADVEDGSEFADAAQEEDVVTDEYDEAFGVDEQSAFEEVALAA